MEVEKTRLPDQGAQRVQGFLLGLIFVLSTLYVALEFTQRESDSYSVEATDDDFDDTELAAVDMPKDMMVLPPREEPQVAEQLRVVEEAEPPQESEEPEVLEGLETDAQAGEEQTVAEPIEQPPTDLNDNPLNFRVVQELPEFPGGAVAFMKWLTKTLRYPIAAQRQGIEGKVVTQFIVERDGSISGLKVAQSLSPLCDREALRVLRMMPKWKAGQQNEKPCRTMVCIPIVFKL